MPLQEMRDILLNMNIISKLLTSDQHLWCPKEMEILGAKSVL
jgi:hypothetical protein